jgi:hypothetical protein
MDTDGIKRRIGRLDELSRGLAKEVVLMKAGDDPLLYLERKAYLTAIQDALAGVEGARVATARVRGGLAALSPPASSERSRPRACSPRH